MIEYEAGASYAGPDSLTFSGQGYSITNTPQNTVTSTYHCEVVADCWSQTSNVRSLCPQLAEGMDTALLRCDGHPGLKHGWVTHPLIAKGVLDQLGHWKPFMPWKHEVMDLPAVRAGTPIPESNLQAWEGYSHSGSFSVHYAVDNKQLLPLVNTNADMGDSMAYDEVSVYGTPDDLKRDLASKSTNLRGCHGTSGSGIFRAIPGPTVAKPTLPLTQFPGSMGYIPIGIATNGGHMVADGSPSSGSLCHPVGLPPDPRDATSLDGLATNFYLTSVRDGLILQALRPYREQIFYDACAAGGLGSELHLAAADLGIPTDDGYTASCGEWPWDIGYEVLTDAFFDGVTSLTWQFSTAGLSLDGSAYVPVNDGTSVTLVRGGGSSPDSTTIVIASVRMDEGCHMETFCGGGIELCPYVCPEVSLNANGVPVATFKADSQNAPGWISLSASLPTSADTTVSVSAEHTTAKVFQAAIRGDGETLDFNSFLRRMNTVVSRGEVGAIAHAPVFAPDSQGNYQAMLTSTGEMFVVRDAAVEEGAPVNLRFDFSGASSALCGLVDENGVQVLAVKCYPGRTLRLAPSGDGRALFPFIMLDAPDATTAWVRGVAVGTHALVDTDGDGIVDRMDNAPLVPNPSQEGCESFGDFALYGDHAVRVDDRARVVTTEGQWAPVANAGYSESRVGCDAHVGTFVSAGTVALADRARVHGDLLTASTVSLGWGAAVEGRQLGNIDVGLVHEVSALSNWYEGAPDRFVTGQMSPGAMPPGDYGRVIVYSGAVVYLEPGLYRFRELFTEPGAEIRFGAVAAKGPSTLLVKDALQYKGRFVDLDAAAIADVLILYLGTQEVPVLAPLYGTIFAPNAKVNLQGLNGTPHVGAVIAREVELQPDGLFEWARFPGGLEHVCSQ